MNDVTVILAETCEYCHMDFDHIHSMDEPVVINWYILHGMCGKVSVYKHPVNLMDCYWDKDAGSFEEFEDNCTKDLGHDGPCGWSEDNFRKTL